MRKLVIIFALLSLSFAFAGETRIPGATPYIVIGRSIPWSTFAAGGQTYVIDADSPALGICVQVVNNNTTNARTFNLGVEMTADSSVTTFAGNQSHWILVNIGQPYSVPASGSQTFFFNTNGAFHIVIGPNGQGGTAGGAPDTADIFVVQNSACQNGATNAIPQPFLPLVATGPNQWTIISHPAVAVQATVVKAAIPNVRHTAQCYAFAIDPNAAAIAGQTDFQILDGATVVWDVAAFTGNTIGAGMNQSLCGLNIVGTSGNTMTCQFASGGASVFESVSCSGYDQ